MPFCPHTDEEIRSMLASIGVASIDDLFDEIPAKLRASLDGVPEQVGELEISRIMHERAARDGQPLCFIGAGAYEHTFRRHLEIATRGEYTALTRPIRPRPARARSSSSTNSSP
jgi:glycine dehydrogenase subunit 1